ncbi:MAG: HU family DNA-binding protein [Paludibacteraceae bacterium]|nr:HU family DNA-binding protein [Paludibacteraceae bacterium]
MTTKELISDIAAASGISKAEVSQLVSAISQLLADTLLQGTPVHIQDFGDFELRDKKERITVHPKTGVRTLTPAKKQITFKQNPTLKADIKNI